MRRRILFLLLFVAVAIQFIRPSLKEEQHTAGSDLIAVTHPDSAVERVLRSACYDCHSDHAAFPWYASITPINFWLQHHVEEGREEFNMSTWAERTDKWRKHKASEARHEVSEGGMPLSSYTWMHPEARLSAEDRKRLTDFFGGLMK